MKTMSGFDILPPLKQGFPCEAAIKKPKPINKTVVIDSQSKLDFIMNLVANLPFEPVYAVHVYEDRETRRTAQNALYWRWNTFIAGDGESFSTKEEVHEHYKGKFLVHIYERDDPEYAAMIEAVRSVHRAGMKAEAKRLQKEIIKLTSTTTASVQQFTEYLQEIENDCNNMGIYLPHKEDDQYRKAMGIK